MTRQATSQHDSSASERAPARGGRADPGEPRSGHGAGRRRRRREDDGPRGGPRRRGARGLPRRRVRADLTRGPETGRGRHRVEHVAAASDAARGAARRTPSASTCSTNRVWRARSRCTTSCIASAPQDRVLLVGDVRQHQAVDAGPTLSAAPGGGHRDGPARRHRAAEGPGPQAGRRATVARRGARRDPAISSAQGRVHEIADRERAVHRDRARVRQAPGGDAGRVAGQSVARWRSTRRSTG